MAALPAPILRLGSLIVIALARCRLHVSVVLIARTIGAVSSLALAPDLVLSVHIFTAPGARRARAEAGSRRDFDIMRAAMVRGMVRMVR